MSLLAVPLHKWLYRAHCAAGSILPNAICESGAGSVIGVGTSEGSFLAYEPGVAEPFILPRFETISVVLTFADTNDFVVVCVEGTIALVEVQPSGVNLIFKTAGPINCLCGASHGQHLVTVGSLDRHIDVMELTGTGTSRYLVRRQHVSVPGQVYAVEHFFMGGRLHGMVALARLWQVVLLDQIDCPTVLQEQVLRLPMASEVTSSDVDPSVADDSSTKSLALGASVLTPTTNDINSPVIVAIVTEDGFGLLFRIDPPAKTSVNSMSRSSDVGTPTSLSELTATLIFRFKVPSALPRVGYINGAGLFCVVSYDGRIHLISPFDGSRQETMAIPQCVALTWCAKTNTLAAVSNTELVRFKLHIPLHLAT